MTQAENSQNSRPQENNYVKTIQITSDQGKDILQSVRSDADS